MGQDPRAKPPRHDRLLNVLHRRKQNWLKAVVRRFTNNLADAEDLEQDVHATTLVPGRLENVRNLQKYLYRVAKNRASRKAREAKRLQPLDEGLNESRVAGDNPSGDADLESLLTDALAKLTPREREVLMLHASTEELTYDDIAQRIGISEHAVEVHLCEAKRKVTQIFSSSGQRKAQR